MARQDIAGLLTGMPQQQRPNPNMSSAEWRLAFGQQQSDNMARGLQGAVGGLTGAGMSGAASPQEQIQIADLKAQERMATLDMTNLDDLRTLASMQMSRGDRVGAAQTASMIDRKEKESAALAKETNTRQSLIRIAKKQNNDEIVDFLENNGALGTAASVVFGRAPATKASSLTKVEEADYGRYWDRLTDEQKQSSGVIEEGILPFGLSDSEDDGKLRDLFLKAEALYTNNPELGREKAFLQILNLASGNGEEQVTSVNEKTSRKDRKDANNTIQGVAALAADGTKDEFAGIPKTGSKL